MALMTARSIIWFQKIEDLNYTNFYTFTRVDGICIGCIIALLQHIDLYFLKRKMTVIVITLAVINFIFYFLNQPYGFLPYLALVGYTTFAILFGFLVYESVTGNNKIIHSVFTIKPLRFLGKISYGFYIFHWPVYQIAKPVLEEKFQSAWGLSLTASRITCSFLAIILTLLLSIASYYWFESKFLQLKKYFVR
jgi:peptidoglycan/LPS O-acetylase OafA/YrhL